MNLLLQNIVHLERSRIEARLRADFTSIGGRCAIEDFAIGSDTVAQQGSAGVTCLVLKGIGASFLE